MTSLPNRWISIALLMCGLLAATSCSKSEASRYEFERVEDELAVETFAADNLAEELRCSFGQGRLTITPLGAVPEANETWKVDMSLASLRRGDEEVALDAPATIARGERLEIDRGGLTEWYVNDESGLEQGFDIAQRPPGSGPLVVELDASGDLRPRLADEDTVLFSSNSGQLVMRYSGLVVRDANGRELEAHMEVRSGRRVLLVAEDDAATYPVVIDPRFEMVRLNSSDAWTTGPAPDPLADEFGKEVALDGDVAVVAANISGASCCGGAYIFERDRGGTGNWGELGSIFTDEFVSAVSISGDTIVLSTGREGIFVLSRDQGGANNWGQVASLTPDNWPTVNYGCSVDVDGDMAIVGECGHAAHIFERDAGGADNWGQVRRHDTSSGSTDDGFARSVAVSADVAVVGAPFISHDGLTQAGLVEVYGRNEGGTDNWGRVKTLMPSDVQNSAHFGSSVAAGADSIVVGAVLRGINQASMFAPGGAYVFDRDQGGPDNWGEVKILSASDPASMEEYGRVVAISGDVIVVGTTYDDDEGDSSGAAYAYRRDQGGVNNWGEIAKLEASDSVVDDNFGHAVAISAETALVGASGWLSESPPLTGGAAYIFNVGNTRPVPADDTATVAEDDTVTIDVLANDTDAEGDALTASLADPPTHGGAVVNNDQTITYSPDPDYNGDDSFTYEAADAHGARTASVAVTVEPVNDAPEFVSPTPQDGEVVDATEAEELVITLAAADVDGDELTYDATALPDGASFDSSSHQIRWTPGWQDAGEHTVGLSVTDGELGAGRQVTIAAHYLDSDDDGLADTWEDEVGLDSSTNDSDGDTIADGDEAGDTTGELVDSDGDGVPDALDDDSDGDGVADVDEAGDDDPATPPVDSDGDGTPDYLDTDSDNDGIDDANDNCPVDPNVNQIDSDNNGIGDVCELDSDDDGVDFADDNCPLTSNPDQRDSDGDGVGDVCDSDRDGDLIPNELDNCAGTANFDQADSDNDGVGDACATSGGDDGCGCSSSRGSAPLSHVLLVLVGLVVLGRRRRRRA